RDHLELRHPGQHVVLPPDPVAAHAGLPVRDAAQAVAEDPGGSLENLGGIGQRDAPDEQRATPGLELVTHGPLLPYGRPAIRTAPCGMHVGLPTPLPVTNRVRFARDLANPLHGAWDGV